MRRPILLLLVAVVVSVAAIVLVVVTDPFGGDEPAPEQDRPFTTTPLDEVDTLTITVARAAFCADIDPREIEAALGSPPTGDRSYDNGDEVGLAEDVTDVAHEFGCTWSLDDGSQARAWVFAPPVDRGRATGLAKAAARREGCSGVEGPAYGEPTVALLCTDGPLTSSSYRGLFGDAWLTCELLAPAPADGTEAFIDRTGAWCAAVARAAAA